MSAQSAPFRDRRDAGRALAGALRRPPAAAMPLVLGLARGGVPVGWEVADALAVPFDVFLVRKLGVPRWPELAMGALTTGGRVVLNADVIAGQQVSDAELQQVIDREEAELRRREHRYRAGRPPTEPAGRAVILVDDGIATGASMLAAIRAIRSAGASTVTVAVPVGPGRSASVSLRHIEAEADAVVCAITPPNFRAVGQVYADFTQTTDEEVCELLAASA
ncbi:phosphoribosyltransferase [Mycolicibacterium bacteremicum]|uniref:Phosphoribosyl transferase n=1 Tax=Mycolicibacterium bacteremicum TaxID=564198 RepID=A0A1W9Z1K1_MYCBA|nr:phosphoribosyltransferase family protein [Mycolicibacterium bacteremicum]MCV7433012.1 phosphoribosyltransferase [Mycolicibacterium bacteremicum]ORA06183.1 phosphoribosyl transferase [Mycolicibacterium bacteremicum]